MKRNHITCTQKKIIMDTRSVYCNQRRFITNVMRWVHKVYKYLIGATKNDKCCIITKIKPFCITKNFPRKRDFMFLGFLSQYFWYLMQVCVILKCNFVYSEARILPYFFGQWFWFVLSVLVSKFVIAFSPDQALFFVGDVHQSDHFKTVIILVQTFLFFSFTIYNLQW